MLWGIVHVTKGGIDGDTERLMYSNPRDGWLIFRTKRECKAYIDNYWSYYKTSKDLRAYPYGYRLPKPVKIEIKRV